MRNIIYPFILSKFKVSRVVRNIEKYAKFTHKNIYRNTYLSPIPFPTCTAIVNLHQIRAFSSKRSKYFQETENEYAHQIMETLSDYSHSLLKYPLEIDKCQISSMEFQEEIFDKFSKVTADNLSDGLSLEEKKFSGLVEEMCSSLPCASDEDVQRTLHNLCLWPPTPKTTTPNFKALWNTLDQECVKRLKNWDVSRKLLIADYWFYLRLNRISQYNRKMIVNLVEDIDTLSNQQIVQLMFYINLQRKIPQLLLTPIEKKLESVINSIAIEEVGVICLGFFKTANKISNKILIESIAKQLIRNVENANTVTVVAILKLLRKSFNFSLSEIYISVLHKCVSHLKKWDIPTNVHVALLSSECNVYHPLLFNCISERVTDEIGNCRIKDYAKLIHCLSLFNYCYKEELHDLIFAEVLKENRCKEINMYPEHLVHLVSSYTYLGKFNYELLSIIFNKQFVEECASCRPETIPVFVEIDYCVEIECQDYCGPRLDKSLRSVLENRRGNLPSKSLKQNMQTRLLNDIYNSLTEILGDSTNILITHILPHFYSPDIIVRLSSKNERPLADICCNFSSDIVLVPPSNEVWACFVPCGLFSFAYRSKHMTGITVMKLRQLQKLGYHVIPIPFFNLPFNASQRKQYLKEQLNILKKNDSQQLCYIRF